MNHKNYFKQLCNALIALRVTDRQGKPVKTDDAMQEVLMAVNKPAKDGHRVFFVGNGGSASIASHMAIDFTKNGNIRSLALNDSSALTCLSNDYSYDEVFSKQIEQQAKAGDTLIAISSSGKSINIINAAIQAHKMGCIVYTLTGFQPDNRLRKLGDLNFYVSAKSKEYGFVEVAHTAILHCILDYHCGLFG